MPIIAAIGLDADDTLWHNERLFEERHRDFCRLLSEYHEGEAVEAALYRTEMRNLPLYGYGVKAFTLSCIETAIHLTEGRIAAGEIQRILERCKAMLERPVELLEGVAETVDALARDYRLLLITKGDLRDQERKVAKSGLAHCFERVEVVSDKSAATYERILQRHQIRPEAFLMAGNSIKSDVLPALDLGAHAAHIPYPLCWKHERAAPPPEDHPRFHPLDRLAQLPELLARL